MEQINPENSGGLMPMILVITGVIALLIIMKMFIFQE
jgi:hypothetical protein